MYWQVLLFIVILLLIRLSGIFNLYFFEEDEVTIATGVASLVLDNIGDLYRYTPQLGYYRLVQFINLVSGGDVSLIPIQMKVLSALMGVLIPCLGLFLFREIISTRTRWLVALVLAANPILWKSSQYGNSAVVSTALVCFSMVLLSNRPGRRVEFLSLALFCAAVIVRADSVVLMPLVAWLLYRNHLSVRSALMVSLGTVLGLLLLYTTIFLLDSRLDNVLTGVSKHFNLSRPSMFWEYLLWAISPLPLFLAVIGVRKLLEFNSTLLPAILLWLLLPLGFYFISTTTPRYFLLVSMPFAVGTAIGMVDVAQRLASITRPVLAWTGVTAAAFIHLVVGVGHMQSDWLASPLYAPRIRTDDGWMPTGALVYDTHLRGGFLHQSFLNPGFGKLGIPHWEGVAFEDALEVLLNDERAENTVLILLDSGFAPAFHFHLQVAGAEYISREPTVPWLPFRSETWLRLGSARIMTIFKKYQKYADMEQFDVQDGDEIWLMGDDPFPLASDLEKLPGGLSLVATDSFNEKFRTFRVVERSNRD